MTTEFDQASKELETAKQGVLQVNQELVGAKQRRNTAEQDRKTAEEQIKQAEQAVQQAQARLAQTNQRLQREVKSAQVRLEKSQRQEAFAREQQRLARIKAQEAAGLVSQRLAELNALNTNLNQARSQLDLVQRDLANSTRDTLVRIERQTGVKSAIIYVSFISIGEDRASDQLRLWIITENSQLQVHTEGATRGNVQQETTNFNIERGPSFPRRTDFLASSRRIYNWMIKPLEEVLQDDQIENLVFLMEPDLRSLPVAALYNGQSYLVEKYSLGIMPGLALADVRHIDIRRSRLLGVGVSESREGTSRLPGVSEELDAIQSAWSNDGITLLNQEATLDNLRSQLQGRTSQIVHIATSGDFLQSDPSASFIQLWDSRLRIGQLGQLDWLANSTELLVIASSSAGRGNEDLKFGFAGAAIQAGVPSVLASLTNISDSESVIFMTEFYKQLQTAPIKAEALRQAQLSMIKGGISRAEQRRLQTKGSFIIRPVNPNDSFPNDNLSDPYYWAGFTIIGNPW